MTSRLYFASAKSSLGFILVAQNSQDEVTDVCLADTNLEVEQELRDRHPTTPLSQGNSASLLDILGKLVAFTENPTIDLDVRTNVHGTDFQREVWRAIRKIPVGQTTTYADIAARTDSPTAVRAVAQACGANPLALIVPCHRVLKSDGGLSGYRWGEDRKRKILECEKRVDVHQLDKPTSSAFARGEGAVHVVPMSVIRRPMPSELDESKVQAFMAEMRFVDFERPRACGGPR